MSTHNIGFYEDLPKIIFQLSSNTHLISSSVNDGLQLMVLDSKTNLFVCSDISVF